MLKIIIFVVKIIYYVMFSFLFRYIEPIWLGTNNKVSIRRVLTLVFSFNLVWNISKVINNPRLNTTYSDVAILLGIEAGLITALMGMTTYSNTISDKKNIDPSTQQSE